MRQARSDTGNVSVSLTRPSFSRWNKSSIVMSLLIEAGGIGVKPSLAHSTCPVAASIKSACSALVFISALRGAERAEAGKGWQRSPRNRGIELLQKDGRQTY